MPLNVLTLASECELVRPQALERQRPFEALV